MSQPRRIEREVVVAVDRRRLPGYLHVPPDARGIVLFAHGSGSGRHSPRNQHVARVLEAGGLATLLLDLLEEEEAADRRLVFDVALLADRLLAATELVAREPATRQLALGYFGASTGAAAALIAAARPDATVGAVVSRGGRPDLARPVLELVRAPTLLVVGGLDYGVIGLNEEAYAALRGEKRLEIVPGATHLFEEPGTLDRVAELAREWFTSHLRE